jgi:hypothetical protein
LKRVIGDESSRESHRARPRFPQLDDPAMHYPKDASPCLGRLEVRLTNSVKFNLGNEGVHRQSRITFILCKCNEHFKLLLVEHEGERAGRPIEQSTLIAHEGHSFVNSVIEKFSVIVR